MDWKVCGENAITLSSRSTTGGDREPEMYMYSKQRTNDHMQATAEWRSIVFVSFNSYSWTFA
jgi:hypothetical protein